MRVHSFSMQLTPVFFLSLSLCLSLSMRLCLRSAQLEGLPSRWSWTEEGPRGKEAEAPAGGLPARGLPQDRLGDEQKFPKGRAGAPRPHVPHGSTPNDAGTPDLVFFLAHLCGQPPSCRVPVPSRSPALLPPLPQRATTTPGPHWGEPQRHADGLPQPPVRLPVPPACQSDPHVNGSPDVGCSAQLHVPSTQRRCTTAPYRHASV